MVLNISYEPGSDVIITEFVPPPDTPMEDQYKASAPPSPFRVKRDISLYHHAKPW